MIQTQKKQLIAMIFVVVDSLIIQYIYDIHRYIYIIYYFSCVRETTNDKGKSERKTRVLG